ncbi:MAG: hypothetical protein LBT89_01535 [Planctomycetaceae bacterium]|jgi:hypothetical protein|nr:hypothetical protein [Planctomycetaceae bacterium]
MQQHHLWILTDDNMYVNQEQEPSTPPAKPDAVSIYFCIIIPNTAHSINAGKSSKQWK